MRALAAGAALMLLAAGAPYETAAPGGDSLARPLPGLDPAARGAFDDGGGLFRHAWVIGPSLEASELTGLGPLYNRLSCVACHVKNGRGPTPDAENGVARAMVLRLGAPGRDRHGGPLPHPAYGAQLNPEGVPGVAGEGRAIVDFDEFETHLDDGAAISMRRRRLSLRDLAYGPIGAETPTSLRNAPPLIGLGLLEAVPEEEILAHAAGPGGGRPNHVHDMAAGRISLGRFGLKANQPDLRQQIANAFAEDIGVSSALFPQAGCAPAQAACRAAAGAGVELSDQRLDAVVAYLRGLAVPARRDPDDPRVRRGAALFVALGCEACHRATLRLGAVHVAPALSDAEIHPYTDLLLHDMGDGLADGRADFEAGPRDWRTPPLWGLGLSQKFGPAGLLHDARARTTSEAILWHDGEARAAQQRFRALPRAEREALLAFLDSL